MLRQSSWIRGLPSFCHIVLPLTSVPQFPEFCNPRTDNQIPWFSKNPVWRILYFLLIPSLLGIWGKPGHFATLVSPMEELLRLRMSRLALRGRRCSSSASFIYWIIRKALQLSLQNGADWETYTTHYSTLASNLNGPIHPIPIAILQTDSQVRSQWYGEKQQQQCCNCAFTV